MRTVLVFLILFPAFCHFQLSAQSKDKNITITGTVLDAKGQPIENAIVMIDGLKTKILTNSKGKYRIRVKPSDTRIGIFTFGYGIGDEVIDGRTAIDFNFERVKSQNRNSGITLTNQNAVAHGDEPVEVGYGHLKLKDLTTDISYIDGTKKNYTSYGSVYEMIRREVSGVRITGNDAGGYNIIIQDAGNMIGSVPPLLILDDTFVQSYDGIPPSTVESISVLKGTAAAIYGSRGYGGAVIVKTKTYDEY